MEAAEVVIRGLERWVMPLVWVSAFTVGYVIAASFDDPPVAPVVMLILIAAGGCVAMLLGVRRGRKILHGERPASSAADGTIERRLDRLEDTLSRFPHTIHVMEVAVVLAGIVVSALVAIALA